MEKITDHVDQGLARVPYQMQDKPKYLALLTIFLERWQEVENAFWDLFVERFLDSAENDQLGILGFIVGQPRNGLLDDVYRRYIRARIATNRSNGTVEELLQIIRLIAGNDEVSIRAIRQDHATLLISVTGAAVTAELQEIIRSFLFDAKAGGVRIILQSADVAPDDLFYWDTTTWDDHYWASSVE